MAYNNKKNDNRGGGYKNNNNSNFNKPVMKVLPLVARGPHQRRVRD